MKSTATRAVQFALLSRPTARLATLLSGLMVVALLGCNKADKSGDAAKSATVQAAKVKDANGPLTGKGKVFSVSLTFEPKAPKVSQLFSVRTVVTKLDGSKVTPTLVDVDATMPSHGHGMMTKPQHKALADGAWRSEGMKLHMHGAWLFEVKVQAGGQSESIKMPFDQPPEAR